MKSPLYSFVDLIALDGLEDLVENDFLEFKLGIGRDGSGKIPASFFETYSAMANTQGGIIVLGIEERPAGSFAIKGLPNPELLIKQLFDILHNRTKVSRNLLTSHHIRIFDVQDRHVIKVTVPRALRRERPIFIGGNPLTGTYRRLGEGDYLCSEDEVKRMLAEQVEDTRDGRIIEHYTIDDLDRGTLAAYRNRFAVTKPGHPWNEINDEDFLRMIGGLEKDRETGKEWLTLAGLLMFGSFRAIHTVVPHYAVDYQERDADEQRTRWTDRVTTDGTWSGNLYDFYRMVFKKMTEDLKIPFRLEGWSRVDESPVHEAVREALTNALIHADYSDTTPIVIIRRPDHFSFRNPGEMRIPLQVALAGGTSDCRNRFLQKMFQFVGFGDQAGSGIPKIFYNWHQQLWRDPYYTEHVNPDFTELRLTMASMIPEESLVRLRERFGKRFDGLADVQKLALALVDQGGAVTHGHLKSLTSVHPHDISRMLKTLVRDGLLVSTGVSRGVTYSFAESTFGGEEASGDGKSSTRGSKSSSSPPNSLTSTSESPSSEIQRRRALISEEFLRKRKASPEENRRAILAVCEGEYLTIPELAEILNRKPGTLRKLYLGQLVSDGLLEVRYPSAPTHPHQGYRTRMLRDL